MSIEQQALVAWQKAEPKYENIGSSWEGLYPHWRTQVKANFIMGWIAGRENDLTARDHVLRNGVVGDTRQMINMPLPFTDGFAAGYLSRFDDVSDSSQETQSRKSLLAEIKSLQSDWLSLSIKTEDGATWITTKIWEWCPSRFYNEILINKSDESLDYKEVYTRSQISELKKSFQLLEAVMQFVQYFEPQNFSELVVNENEQASK